MGVIYKLKEEVVHFIISQRQGDPLASCRQLAESASLKFSLHLSKSSVHEVLKESGIITPRGRKPKDKFQIPQEKKKQIQDSLSQVGAIHESPLLLPKPSFSVVASPSPRVISRSPFPSVIARSPKGDEAIPERTTDPVEIASVAEFTPECFNRGLPRNDTREIYEGAGRIFLKAALWDLGIFSQENIKASDWDYYLTYAKGIKVILENNKSFFIDLALPLERCIKELTDGFINNVKPLVVHQVSDQELFKACMDAQAGFKIKTVSIVDEKDHILLELGNIVEHKRNFILKNRVFMENNERNLMERSKAIFFPQLIDNNNVIENILNLKGFSTINKDENVVTLLFDDSYDNKIGNGHVRSLLQEAAEILNGMYLRDEQDRLVKVNVSLRGPL